MPENMADRKATAQAHPAEIGPSEIQRPSKPHASMRVMAFSSATGYLTLTSRRPGTTRTPRYMLQTDIRESACRCNVPCGSSKIIAKFYLSAPKHMAHVCFTPQATGTVAAFLAMASDSLGVVFMEA